MFQGHDTTATSVIWTLFLLGHHPKIQEEVYAEVKNVIDSKQKDLITLADLADMKLLERVIKESMRLCPSVFSIGRILEEDVKFGQFYFSALLTIPFQHSNFLRIFDVSGEYSIPKGTNAFLNIYVLHRDPKHFKDPEIFDPDRFLPENCLKRHPYAYIPFSAGPRNCIGKRIIELNHKLIRNIKILFKRFRPEVCYDRRKGTFIEFNLCLQV